MRLRDRVVLVTGGASGIGKAIVERFSDAGAAVALLDIDGEGARRVAASLPPDRPVMALAGDVASESDVRSAVDSVVNRWRRLDILINNAGIEVNGTVLDVSSQEWDRQIAVNLKGAFLCSRYAIPHMRGRGGVILNVASVHALVSWAGSMAYDASKAGLIGLTRAMALDHGRDGIRVNAICPGYIQTPLLDQWLASVPDREETMRQVLGAHPLGRIGTPPDIAEACLFLASDAASFISGTYLVVDGAMTAAGH